MSDEQGVGLDLSPTLVESIAKSTGVLSPYVREFAQQMPSDITIARFIERLTNEWGDR